MISILVVTPFVLGIGWPPASQRFEYSSRSCHSSHCAPAFLIISRGKHMDSSTILPNPEGYQQLIQLYCECLLFSPPLNEMSPTFAQARLS
jgi:hypothetical protein